MKTTVFTATVAFILHLQASSAIVGHTFTGVTVDSFSQPADLKTEFPAGTKWTMRVEWDDAAAALDSGTNYSQFRLTKFTITLQGKSGPWTTSSVAGKASFSLLQLGSDGLQFTSGSGPADHTNPNIGSYQPLSVNLSLEDLTGNAFTSLTPAPSSVDLSKWDPARSNFKMYLDNSGTKLISGTIDFSDTTSKPEISVKPTRGNELVDGKASSSFGKSAVGKKGTARTFVISNTGKAPLTNLKVGLTGSGKKDYKVSKLKQTQLAPRASTKVTVTFTPKKSGVRRAVLKISSNDANENPFDINLSGTGR